MPNKNFIAAFAALLLSACATVAKDHFYTLDAISPPASVVKSAPHYRIAVGPVHVPEMADRPEMVIRQGPNRVKVLEEHRWAQSLKSGIAHVLAADLDMRLDDAQVTSAEDYASRNANYRITVDIERFDATPGDAVAVEAMWTIFDSGGKPLKTGRSAAQDPIRGNDYAAVAAAYSQALSSIANDIGNIVRSSKAASFK